MKLENKLRILMLNGGDGEKSLGKKYLVGEKRPKGGRKRTIKDIMVEKADRRRRKRGWGGIACNMGFKNGATDGSPLKDLREKKKQGSKDRREKTKFYIRTKRGRDTGNPGKLHLWGAHDQVRNGIFSL